jgi:hypothetical protein
VNIDRHFAEVMENDAIRADEQLLLGLLAACNPTRRGGSYVCLCPVHAERTPSCEVKRGKDGAWRWRCYGCGKSGDAFDLVVAVDGCTFRQARERLGARMVVPVAPPPPLQNRKPRENVACTCARMWWELHEGQLLTGPRCRAHSEERAPSPPSTYLLTCERRGCCSQLDVTLVKVAVMLDAGEVVETAGDLRWVCRPCVRRAERQRAFFALWTLLHAPRRERLDAGMTRERSAA